MKNDNECLSYETNSNRVNKNSLKTQMNIDIKLENELIETHHN